MSGGKGTWGQGIEGEGHTGEGGHESGEQVDTLGDKCFSSCQHLVCYSY